MRSRYTVLRSKFSIPAVAADGTIVYLERNPASGSDLWRLSPDGQQSPLIVTP